MQLNNAETKDKRAIKRAHISLKIIFPSLKVTSNIFSETIDISLSGISILTNYDIKEDNIDIIIYFNDKSSVKINTNISWRKALNEDTYCFGLMFSDLNDNIRNKIAYIIDSCYKDQDVIPYIETNKKYPNIAGLKKAFTDAAHSLTDFLAKIEKQCLIFEKNNHPLTLNKQIQFINSHRGSYMAMDKYFEILWKVSKEFGIKEKKIHNEYFQKIVHSYFVRDTTPLNKRIYEKPLGYGGDFGVMNYMYADGYSGDDTYSKFIERYTLYLPESRAHLFRRPYLNELIIKSIQQFGLTGFRVASFACGPAVEILDVLKNNVSDKVSFVLIDGEKLALNQVEKNIALIEKERNHKFEIKLLNINVVELIRSNFILNDLKDMDLAYSAGFFDYLTDRTCSRLISYIYKLLKPGGVFVGVNIYEDNPSKVIMEMLGGWYLNHRNETRMLGLARNLPDSEIRVDWDPTRTNIYLTVKKIK